MRAFQNAFSRERGGRNGYERAVGHVEESHEETSLREPPGLVAEVFGVAAVSQPKPVVEVVIEVWFVRPERLRRRHRGRCDAATIVSLMVDGLDVLPSCRQGGSI